MILVIVNKSKSKNFDGAITSDEVVSHGIDLNNNDMVVTMPNVHPSEIGAKFDLYIGEYILEGTDIK